MKSDREVHHLDGLRRGEGSEGINNSLYKKFYKDPTKQTDIFLFGRAKDFRRQGGK